MSNAASPSTPHSSRRLSETPNRDQSDAEAFLGEPLGEKDRRGPLTDAKIVRLETVPLTSQALVSLFNDFRRQLGGLVRVREVVEVISAAMAKSVA